MSCQESARHYLRSRLPRDFPKRARNKESGVLDAGIESSPCLAWCSTIEPADTRAGWRRRESHDSHMIRPDSVPLAIDAADDDLAVVYCRTDALSDDAVHAAVAQLSDEERARHDRFMFARDRRDFACAHALLRRALSARGGLAP